MEMHSPLPDFEQEVGCKGCRRQERAGWERGAADGGEEVPRNKQKQSQRQRQERNKALPCQGSKVLRRDLIFHEVT